MAMSILTFFPMVPSLVGMGLDFPEFLLLLLSHDPQSSEPTTRNVCVLYISFLKRELEP